MADGVQLTSGWCGHGGDVATRRQRGRKKQRSNDPAPLLHHSGSSPHPPGGGGEVLSFPSLLSHLFQFVTPPPIPSSAGGRRAHREIGVSAPALMKHLNAEPRAALMGTGEEWAEPAEGPLHLDDPGIRVRQEGGVCVCASRPVSL